MTKIVRLQSENVKRIRAVEIRPDGSTVVVGGRNGQGKTSLLDTIEYVLAPKDHQCAEPVRRGEKKARGVIDLDNGLTVTRTMTPGGGGSLKVTAKDGAAYPSPQAMLDRLVGQLTFDPLAFMRLKPRDQADAVKRLVGVDFGAEDARRAKLYGERQDINREANGLGMDLERMPFHEDAPDGEVDTAALRKELADSHRLMREYDAARAEASEGVQKETKLKGEIMLLEQRLASTRAALDRQKAGRATVEGKVVELGTQLTKVRKPEEIDAAMAEAEDLSRKARANAERKERAALLDAKRAEAERLTRAIGEVDAAKAARLSAAEFPVHGLSFGEQGLTLYGLPLEQASSAEQLRVSVGMGLALNPELKVLLVRDGSLLDSESLAMVANLAQTADAQVWIERVGEGEECSVIIEDGLAVERPAKGGKGAKAAPPPAEGPAPMDIQVVGHQVVPAGEHESRAGACPRCGCISAEIVTCPICEEDVCIESCSPAGMGCPCLRCEENMSAE